MDKLLCNKCLSEKTISEFYRSNTTKRGYQTHCKECKDGSITAYKLINKDKLEQARIRWVEKNRHRISASSKRYADKKENKMKMIAHRVVRSAIKEGIITKEKCKVCGEANSDAHHEDYNRPYDVVWLCRFHHVKRHMEITANNL